MRLPTLFKRRSKAALPATGYGVGPGTGWSRLATFYGPREGFGGAWQRAIHVSTDDALQHSAIWSVVSQIAGDVGKLRPHVRQLSGTGGFWSEVANPAYSPVLARPNPYQTPAQFLETWLLSKLISGNAYLLKARDGRGVVTGLYPLDPHRVMPLVANDGSAQVFYQLSPDNLTYGLTETVVVPAREMIHDRGPSIYHPLVGVSPLYAAATAVAGGLSMGRSTARFFQRGAALSGVLTAPGAIDPDTAKRLEDKWDNEMTGDANAGKIAILGSGLEFKSMQSTLVDAQVAELMKWSFAEICAAFSVPNWKIFAEPPRGVSVQQLQILYLEGCLQRHIIAVEQCLTAGLGMAGNLRAALDESELLRLDTVSLGTFLREMTGAGIYSPNEARAKLGLPPVAGGDIPLAQQQMWPINLLSDPARGVPTAATQPALPAPAAEAAK